MGRKAINLIGQRFGHSVVLEREGTRKASRSPTWKCRCDCGNEYITTSARLKAAVKSGKPCTCGCGRKGVNKKHGLSNHPLFKVWGGMHDRCRRKKNHAFSDYGGRGIFVCKEWGEFEPFFKWAVSHGYKEGLSIDRIDVDGNYEPENCRWATNLQQQRNKRTMRMITFNGETHCISEWSEITGLHHATICGRLRSGLPIEEVLSPKRKRNRNVLYEYNGEIHTLIEWSKICGVDVGTIRYRLNHGKSIEEALRPVKK